MNGLPAVWGAITASSIDFAAVICRHVLVLGTAAQTLLDGSFSLNRPVPSHSFLGSLYCAAM